jgi:gag-polypeptide of LTR copia-type
MFIQGVNNDPVGILRILRTKYQGTDTSSFMSAVKKFTTKKDRPGQHIKTFVAEFEGLAMRLEAIGHGVSEQMRFVNFLNSLSEFSALFFPSFRRFVSETTFAGPRIRSRFCSSQN